MAQKKQQQTGCGCLLALAIIALVIGAIANACSGSSTPADQPLSPGSSATPAAPDPVPAAVPSPARTRHHHHRQHHHHRYVPPPTTAPPPQPACYPTADSGNCYHPGEFCRESDHGDYGLAGDGEKIRCEDNDGWRWEPV